MALGRYILTLLFWDIEMEKYQTSDIALASYLFCSGATFKSIDRQDPHRCIFHFDLPDVELLSNWQGGKAYVNALAYFNAYQFLKGKVFHSRI